MSSEIDLGIANLSGAEVIGRGGFAVVYKATDTRFDREVAVKLLDPMVDEADRRRFDTECRVMGRLSGHPNVVTVYDAGFLDEAQPYLVMEFIEGGSLADLLAERGRLRWTDVQSIAASVADALAHAHQAGVLHRDVKPENILLDKGVTKLTDFGIASVLSRSTAGKSVGFSGTLLHTAPETFSSTRDERSDVYSLASTVHTLLDGQPPFFRATDESVEPLMMRLVTEQAPPLPPGVAPPGVAGVIHRALSKDPADRPQTAAEFAAALRAPPSAPPSPPPPAAPPARPAPPPGASAAQTHPAHTPVHPQPPAPPAPPAAQPHPQPSQPPSSSTESKRPVQLLVAAALGVALVAVVIGALVLRDSRGDGDDPAAASTADVDDTTLGSASSAVDTAPVTAPSVDLASADGDDCPFNTLEIAEVPGQVDAQADGLGCRVFDGELTAEARELDFVVNLAEGQRASVDLQGPCAVALVVVDGRGQAEDPDLACASGVQRVIAATAVTAGEYRLQVRLAESSDAAAFTLELFDVTASSDRFAPDLTQTTCARAVANVVAAPVGATLRFDDGDCPRFVGELRVPGETQDFSVVLGADQRLSIVSMGACSVSLEVLDGRGEAADARLLCASGVVDVATATETTAGVYIVRLTLAEGNNGGDYELILHDVSEAVASVAPEPIDTACVNPVELSSQPTLAVVKLDASDCVYWAGDMAVPGERHEFVVEIGSGEGLDVLATGGCNVSITLIDGRGVGGEPRLLCASGFDEAILPSAAASGSFTLRLELDADSTSDEYELRLSPATPEN